MPKHIASQDPECEYVQAAMPAQALQVKADDTVWTYPEIPGGPEPITRNYMKPGKLFLRSNIVPVQYEFRDISNENDPDNEASICASDWPISDDPSHPDYRQFGARNAPLRIAVSVLPPVTSCLAYPIGITVNASTGISGTLGEGRGSFATAGIIMPQILGPPHPDEDMIWGGGQVTLGVGIPYFNIQPCTSVNCTTLCLGCCFASQTNPGLPAVVASVTVDYSYGFLKQGPLVTQRNIYYVIETSRTTCAYGHSGSSCSPGGSANAPDTVCGWAPIVGTLTITTGALSGSTGVNVVCPDFQDRDDVNDPENPNYNGVPILA